MAALQENQNSLLRGEAVEAEAVIRFETQKDCRLVIMGLSRLKPNDVKKLYCWRHGETVKLAAQKFARCEAWAYKNKRLISVISETWAAAIANCNLHFWRGGKGKRGVMAGFLNYCSFCWFRQIAFWQLSCNKPMQVDPAFHGCKATRLEASLLEAEHEVANSKLELVAWTKTIHLRFELLEFEPLSLVSY